jgi:hypothetical protein
VTATEGWDARMRKTISTILATALLLGGLWFCWEWFTAVDPEGRGARVAGKLFWVGPVLIITGGIWLASDWLDL